MTTPTFPTVGTYMVMDSYQEDTNPGVTEFETEKGPSLMRVSEHRPIQSVQVSVEFHSLQASEAFRNWYWNDVKRVGRFLWPDPRLQGATRLVWFKGGSMGTEVPLNSAFTYFRRTFTLEYVR